MKYLNMIFGLLFHFVTMSLFARSKELNFAGTLIFEDDSDKTNIGDFPAKFVSSAGGEVVSIKDGKGL